MTDEHDAFGAALQSLRYREDLGFGQFNTVTSNARKARFPDFLVIGAQKAGTTWLHENLDFHPSIWFPPAKELNFFNQVYGPSSDQWESEARRSQAAAARDFFSSGISLSARQQCQLAALDVIEESTVSDDWYGRIFSHAPSDDLCGESSSDYCTLPRAGIVHVASLNPKVKAVLLLRDPIDRLWSHLRMAERRGHCEATLEYFHDDYVWRIFTGRSNYPEMIRRWRSILGEDQVILANSDLIKSDPLGVLRSVADGLGLRFDPGFFPNARQVIGGGGGGADDQMPHELYAAAKVRMRHVYDDLVELVPEIAAPWWRRHFAPRVSADEGLPLTEEAFVAEVSTLESVDGGATTATEVPDVDPNIASVTGA